MSDLVEIAVLAYRNARYQDAAEMLEQAIVHKPDDWLGRLYLGMTYRKLNRVNESRRHLEMIIAECPEGELIEQAQRILSMLQADFKKAFGREKVEDVPDDDHEEVVG